MPESSNPESNREFAEQIEEEMVQAVEAGWAFMAGIIAYSSSYLSLQAYNGVYINAIGPRGSAKDWSTGIADYIPDLPEEISSNKGNFYIAGQGGGAVIKSKDTGSIHIKSNLANVELVSQNDLSLEALGSASISANTKITISTPGECDVTIGSLETMLDNAITNIEGTASVSSIPIDAWHGVMGTKNTVDVLTNLKSLRKSKGGSTSSGKNPPGENPPGESPPGESPPGESPPGESSGSVGSEGSSVSSATTGAEDASTGLEDLKGGSFGLLSIAASFLTSYSTMSWGGFSTTAIGNGSTTIVGNGSYTVIGLNSDTYVGSSTTSHLGEVNEVNLAESIKSGVQSIKNVGTKISNTATSVKNYFVSTKDTEVDIEESDLKFIENPLYVSSSEVNLKDSDADISDGELTVMM